MQTVINNLEDRAYAIEEERSAIKRTSEYNHDPVDSVVDATDSLPGFLTPGPGSRTLAAYASTMRDLAEELRSRRQEAIDINESGITMTNPDGTLSYYLPDPPPGTTDEAAYHHPRRPHHHRTGACRPAVLPDLGARE
ncbi:MAG: hypothetical protein Q4A20_11175 [Actinomyces sp.]|nr:DUF6571 family protein [Actinomyces sp.]MDO4901193.1 hypothetical protein [Actinomyces sp.]